MIKFKELIGGLVTCVLMVSLSWAQPEDQSVEPQGSPVIMYITPTMIARGDTVTVVGSNLSKSGVKTFVKIDGQKAQHVKIHSADSIQVLVNTPPKTDEESAGEHKRSLVVVVGERESAPFSFRQLTWQVVLKLRVLIPLILYIAFVVILILYGEGKKNGNWKKNGVFRSVTGQLSLSKIQMGVWTFVFGLAYVVLAAIWWDFLDITEGMFWLMGISSTAAVGAKSIGLTNPKNLRELDKDPKKRTNPPSTLLKDWDKGLNDYRLSLHRCQIALWTLIVLVVYLLRLLGTMHLPDIPDKLLVLMGISGGTYLGFNWGKAKQP